MRRYFAAGRVMIVAATAICIAAFDSGVPLNAQERNGFEVAAIKPPEAGVPLPVLELTESRLVARGASLRYLVTQAFGIADYQVSGAAGWMESKPFAIKATAGKAVDREQMMTMLRGLLTERFKLKVHKETREIPVFALVVDKGGSKLTPLVDGEMSYPKEQYSSSDEMTLAIGPTIEALVRHLNTRTGPNALGRPVIDETKLRGQYRIWLTFSNEVHPAGNSGTLSIDYRAALPRQLGLRLDPKKAQVEFLVIDSAAQPSAD